MDVGMRVWVRIILAISLVLFFSIFKVFQTLSKSEKKYRRLQQQQQQQKVINVHTSISRMFCKVEFGLYRPYLWFYGCECFTHQKKTYFRYNNLFKTIKKRL